MTTVNGDIDGDSVESNRDTNGTATGTYHAATITATEMTTTGVTGTAAATTQTATATDSR